LRVQGKQLCKLHHDRGGHERAVINSLSFHPTSPTLLSACHNQLYLWKLSDT